MRTRRVCVRRGGIENYKGLNSRQYTRTLYIAIIKLLTYYKIYMYPRGLTTPAADTRVYNM